MRPLNAKNLGPGVRMCVEVDEPDRSVPAHDGADVCLRNGVVAAQHDRKRARSND
jgi:hypothetical protein